MGFELDGVAPVFLIDIVSLCDIMCAYTLLQEFGTSWFQASLNVRILIKNFDWDVIKIFQIFKFSDFDVSFRELKFLTISFDNFNVNVKAWREESSVIIIANDFSRNLTSVVTILEVYFFVNSKV